MLTRLVNTAGVACIALLLLLSLLPAREMVRTGAPNGYEHFAAYFLSGIVLSLGIGRRKQLAVAAGLSVIAAVMEVLQHLSPGRTPHLSDFLASSAGATSGVMIVSIITAVLMRRPSVG